jgi:hypothetical protein
MDDGLSTMDLISNLQSLITINLTLIFKQITPQVNILIIFGEYYIISVFGTLTKLIT